MVAACRTRCSKEEIRRHLRSDEVRSAYPYFMFLSTTFYRYTKALDSIKALRKDRVADLKADKERLESLSKEKAHADKLRARIVELNNTITSKQLQYEECKGQYEELVKNNARFYESATKFRELYVKVENLQQKKEHYQQELSEARETVQEIEGTLAEILVRKWNDD